MLRKLLLLLLLLLLTLLFKCILLKFSLSFDGILSLGEAVALLFIILIKEAHIYTIVFIVLGSIKGDLIDVLDDLLRFYVLLFRILKELVQNVLLLTTHDFLHLHEILECLDIARRIASNLSHLVRNSNSVFLFHSVDHLLVDADSID